MFFGKFNFCRTSSKQYLENKDSMEKYKFIIIRSKIRRPQSNVPAKNQVFLTDSNVLQSERILPADLTLDSLDKTFASLYMIHFIDIKTFYWRNSCTAKLHAGSSP